MHPLAPSSDSPVIVNMIHTSVVITVRGFVNIELIFALREEVIYQVWIAEVNFLSKYIPYFRSTVQNHFGSIKGQDMYLLFELTY